ncbi:MAG: hypothetical protein Q8P67_18780 [archaeon]|nr:hypothetical protein [archaeon]
MIKSVGKRLSLGGRKNNAPSRPERILEWLEAIVDSPPHARPDEAARQAHETPVLVPGETILHTVPSVGFWHGKECQSPDAAFVGTLFVTNFALRLNYFSRVDECMSFAPCSIRIPLAAICRLEFSKRRHQHCFKFFSVFSRDFFAGNLAFFRDDSLRFFKLIKAHLSNSAVILSLRHTFASLSAPRPNNEGALFSPASIAPSSPLLSEAFHLIRSRHYPSSVPQDAQEAASRAHEHGLAPSLAWCSPLLYPGSALLEASPFAVSPHEPSPPASAGSGSDSNEAAHPDVPLLAAYQQIFTGQSPKSAEVFLFDTERQEQQLHGFPLKTVDLNLHSEAQIRAAAYDLRKLVWERFSPIADASRISDWIRAYRRTAWPDIVSSFLSASYLVSNAISIRSIGMVSGSDSRRVLLSLAQLILDPAFRTSLGFCRLVYKQWVLGGYLFRPDLRLLPRTVRGHPIGICDNSSSFFLLFLDAVHQLTLILVDQFEFSSSFLIEIFDCVHSAKFSTFLDGSDTSPCWDPLLSIAPQHLNPLFTNNTSNPTTSASTLSPLSPSTSTSSTSSSSSSSSISFSALAPAPPSSSSSSSTSTTQVPAALSTSSTLSASASDDQGELPAGQLCCSAAHPPVAATPMSPKLSSPLVFSSKLIVPWNAYFLRYACSESQARAQCLISAAIHPAHMNITNCFLPSLSGLTLNYGEVFDLRLTQNILSDFHPLLLTCSQLARLTLSTNAIDRFAPHVMLTIAKHLTSLNFLDLSSNCLTELPPDIYRLSTLQSLYLDNNPLTSVSLRLDLMPTLSALKIANSHMSSLFVETPAQSATINLVNLNLSKCRFDQFPVDVCKLVALHELDISHNPLESLPVQLGHLALLSSLNISHCRFSEFPPVIFFLKSLTALKINHNALVALPASVGALELVRFDLSGNPLLDPPLSVVEKGTQAVLSHFAKILAGQLDEADPIDQVLSAATSDQLGMRRRAVQIERKALVKKDVFSFLSSQRNLVASPFQPQKPVLHFDFDQLCAQIAPCTDLLFKVEPDVMACLTGTTYPFDPISRTRLGDPVCDSYAFACYPDRMVVCMTDGCNWGNRPREAAALSCKAFVDSLTLELPQLADAAQASFSLLKACTNANEAIVQGKSVEGNMWYEAGTTTLLGGVLLPFLRTITSPRSPSLGKSTSLNRLNPADSATAPLSSSSPLSSSIGSRHPHLQACTGSSSVSSISHRSKPQTEGQYRFLCVNVGDCKALHYSARRHAWVDITKGNRQDLSNPSDPGGRLGPYLTEGRPDLRNLHLYQQDVEHGDIIVLMSDGIHDNLDLTNLGGIPADQAQQAPPDILYGRSSWRALSEKELATAKDRYLVWRLGQLFPDPSSLSCDHINRVLLDYVFCVTDKQRQFMQADARLKQPDDLAQYPGKLDHSSLVTFRIGEISDPSKVTTHTSVYSHPLSLPPQFDNNISPETSCSSSPPVDYSSNSPNTSRHRPRSKTSAAVMLSSSSEERVADRVRNPTISFARKFLDLRK